MTDQQPKEAEKKTAKKAYVVTRRNCAHGDVGDVVQLSDSQARAMINKVRAKDLHDADQSKGGRKSDLENKVKDLSERLEKANTEIVRLTALVPAQ